jgi:hypothetical protein
MSDSLSYSIVKSEEGLQVQIFPPRPDRKTIILIICFAGTGVITLGIALNFGFASFVSVSLSLVFGLIALVCILISLIFIDGMKEHATQHTLLFSSDQLIVTSSFWVFKRTLAVPLAAIAHFGLGVANAHSPRPALVMKANSKWTILAEQVDETDVDRLVTRIASEGVKLPTQ